MGSCPAKLCLIRYFEVRADPPFVIARRAAPKQSGRERKIASSACGLLAMTEAAALAMTGQLSALLRSSLISDTIS
jgi:hypothetical protein